MQLIAGTSLYQGTYLLNHVLDQQGIGWTYLATQTQLNQRVILKTLNPVFRSHPEYPRLCQDFEARSRTWATLRHPGLVRVLDFFYEDDSPFVVLEAISGVTLSDRLRQETLSEADIIALLRQISSALTYAQDHGLVHGNLRPRNVIRRNATQDYVLVGSAVSLMPSLFERSALQNPYAAPELSHGKLTASADLYSLGAILYTCLSGHSPTLAPIEAAITDRLPLLSLLKPGAIKLLRAAMANQMVDRPATPETWLALLTSRSNPVASPTAPVISVPPPRPIAPPEQLPRYRTDPLPTENPQPPRTLVAHTPNPELPNPIQPPPPLSKKPPNNPFPIPHSPFKTLRQPLRSLKLTAGIAAIGGLVFGLVLRFHAAQRPGASLFHMGQSFPAREWKGTLTPPTEGLADIPIEAPGSGPSRSRSTDSQIDPSNPSDRSIDNLLDQPIEPEIQAPTRLDSRSTKPNPSEKRSHPTPLEPAAESDATDNLQERAPHSGASVSPVPPPAAPEALDPVVEPAPPKGSEAPRSVPNPRTPSKL